MAQSQIQAKKAEQDLEKLLLGLAVGAVLEEQQRQKEEELLKTLLLLSIIVPSQKDILELKSCCSDSCKCKKKKKDAISWVHFCGEKVYLTNHGNIFCKKCQEEAPAQFWGLYCQNGTADRYNYKVNSLENLLFYCGQSLNQVGNKQVATKFLREFHQACAQNQKK